MTKRISVTQNSISNFINPEIEYMSPADIVLDATHPRLASDAQAESAASLISTVGFCPPVIVTDKKEVVVGHEFVLAAQIIPAETIPVIVVQGLSTAQKKMLRIGYYKILESGSFNLELLKNDLIELIDLEIDLKGTGFQTAEIDLIIIDKPDQMSIFQEGETPVPLETLTATKVGDVWELGNNTLVCGDALDLKAYSFLEGHKVRTVITDPPYNVGISGHARKGGKKKHREFVQASGEMTEAEFTHFLTMTFENYTRHLEDGALLYVCMDWRHMSEILAAAKQAGLTLINLCVWNKNNGAMGSFYRSKHELIFVFKFGKGKNFNNVELGKHGRYRTNVWDYAGVNTFKRNRDEELSIHPTVKPVAMIADAILDSTQLGDVVLDSYAGSGTIFIACEKTKRKAYGIELDPLYVEVAIERWQRYTGKSAVHKATGLSFEQYKNAIIAQTSDEVGHE